MRLWRTIYSQYVSSRDSTPIAFIRRVAANRVILRLVLVRRLFIASAHLDHLVFILHWCYVATTLLVFLYTVTLDLCSNTVVRGLVFFFVHFHEI